MSRKRIEFLFSAVIVFLLGWALWEALAWPLHSRVFPWSIGLGVLVLALAQLVGSARRLAGASPPRVDDKDATTISEDFTGLDRLVQRRVIVICSWILAFFLGIWLLGFRVASFLLTLAFLRFSASESWGVSMVAAGTSYLFFLLVFHLVLQVPLAPGFLADSLGLDSLDDYLITPLINR